MAAPGGTHCTSYATDIWCNVVPIFDHSAVICIYNIYQHCWQQVSDRLLSWNSNIMLDNRNIYMWMLCTTLVVDLHLLKCCNTSVASDKWEAALLICKDCIAYLWLYEINIDYWLKNIWNFLTVKKISVIL